jgi:predicted small lipoprotein YifL
MRVALFPMVALLALAGCGTQGELKPAPGHQLPQPPIGRKDRPGANELLGQSTQARPSRNVELHTRSEPRTDDAFDLPPQD